MTDCPRCHRPIGPGPNECAAELVRDGQVRHECNLVAKAYRQGYREAVAMCKEEAETEYVGIAMNASIDWTCVDAKAKEVADG